MSNLRPTLMYAAAFLAVGGTYGQTSLGTSSIGGTVKDASGLGVPSAAVELIDTERGESRKTNSQESGDYIFNGVPAGIYSLKASRAGFETSIVSNVKIEVNQRATVDLSLKVGAVSESVQVNAEGATPLLETASNALGTVIDQTRVEELPLNGRDFMQLGYLAGGTSLPQGSSDVVTSQYQHPDRTIGIAGATQFETSYLIDGIATRGSRLGESSVNLSISAIDQFKIQIGFFMPDQGPNPGIVDVITKSGTNTFHGEAFEFLRNSDLDSRNFFAVTPQVQLRNQFGFALGGPVWIPKLFKGKDRVWFHADYEGTRQIQDFASNGFTPTQAMFGGNFTALPQTIYDPNTFSSASNQRQPFPGNIIPTSRINTVSQKLLQYYEPGASYAEKPSNLFGSPKDTLNDDQFSIRGDVRISDRQSLFMDMTYENSPVVDGGLLPLTGGYYPSNAQVAVIQHTFTFGPNLVNIARIGFSRSWAQDEGQGEAGPNLETPLGITATNDQHGIPGVSLTGFTAFGRAAGPLGDGDNNYQVDEGLNFTRGSHNLAMGFGIRYHRTRQQNSNAGALGTMAFQPIFTAQLVAGTGGLGPVTNTGNSFADFLLGMPASGSVIGLPPLHYRYTEYFPYFQDSWKVAPGLTINYGISWYYSGPPNPQGADRNLPHEFDFQTGQLLFAALNQINPAIFNPDKNNFVPRLGLAWQPKFIKNTVFRAGAGVYYGQQGLIEAQFTAVGPPFNQALAFSNNQFSPQPTYVLGQNVFPVIPLPPLTSTFAATLPSGTTAFVADPDDRTPYMTQWNFSVQHTLLKSDLIEADYVGVSAHDQQSRYDADECLATASLFCSPATRPYPQYASLLYEINNGNLSYQALVLKYEHQFSRGLTLLANYTFSKTLSDGWESGTSTNNQSADCRACDKGPVTYNQPHQVVISTVYELPFGRGRKFGSRMPYVEDALLGGWNLGGIMKFASGASFTVTAPNRTASAYALTRANTVCNGAESQLSGNLRSDGLVDFNTACYAVPATGYFGDSGRGVLLGPGVNNWDTTISKLFALGERARLQFRAEFFNTWNHAQFNNPDAAVGDATFGQVSSARTPREIQGALKLVF